MQARLSLHLSNCLIVGNLMSRLIYTKICIGACIFAMSAGITPAFKKKNSMFPVLRPLLLLLLLAMH